MQQSNGAYDVAIVGLGPTGATLANLLGKAGLSVVVLEREAAIHPLPRAVHFDGEAMRIFQAAGLAHEIAGIARPSSKGMHFVSGTGQTLLIRRGHDGPGPHGWAANWYVHQPHLEAELRRGLTRFPRVNIRLRHDMVAVVDGSRGARITASDLATGEERTFTARFLVGCDGGRSLIRRLIGSTMEDLGLKQPWLVVDIITDPSSPRVQALAEHTIQLCDPSRPMTLVNVSGNRRRWEIMLMPGDDTARMTEPECVWPLLSRWIGPEDGRIERAALYTFHSVIAQGWRKGHLLLAGDSCHQTPPFLGQGMCAGLRDAMNLAWKLAAIVKEGANACILDSYENERRPHVHAFIKLAVELGAIIQATDPGIAAERDRQFASGEPKMFDFPQPQLGTGLHVGDLWPSGAILPQPRLADGRLLDDVTAGRFCLLARGSLADAPTGDRTGVAIVKAESEPAVAALLDAVRADALLLRPDGYAFGTAAEAGELQSLFRRLDAMLAPTANSQGDAP